MSQTYVLEQTHRELDRLDLQGIIYRNFTRRAFEDAGVRSGMHVLDVGCGSGDVSRLVAECVGPDGSVLGVDRDEQAVRSARERSSALGADNVSFAVGDAAAAARQGQFDALVGRFLLMHQPDPAGFLADVAQAVRPGGVVAFVESHMAALREGGHSFPHSPLYDRIVRWKCEVVAVAADIESGLRLHSTFVEAGLGEPELRMEASVGGGPDCNLYRYMVESVRSMLPAARAAGIEGFDDEGVDSLEAALRADVVSSGGTIVCWPAVAAWARVPTPPGAR